MRNCFIIVICTAMLCACSGTRKLNYGALKETGTEMEVKIPINDEYFYDTDDKIRSVANGISLDWNVARNIAITNCRSDIAMKINGKIKTAMENYVKQYSANNAKIIEREIGEIFEQYSITFSEVDVNNIIELQHFSTRNNKTYEYTYWVAMEISKSEIVEEIIDDFDTLPKSVKDKLEYDRNSFRDYLNNSIFNN